MNQAILSAAIGIIEERPYPLAKLNGGAMLEASQLADSLRKYMQQWQITSIRNVKVEAFERWLTKTEKYSKGRKEPAIRHLTILK